MKTLINSGRSKHSDMRSFIYKMKNDNNIMEIENLKLYFSSKNTFIKAIDDVSFDIPKGKTVVIVGESGCGKSSVAFSLMKLLHGKSVSKFEGNIRYNGFSQVVDITSAPLSLIEHIRGNEISMVFQEPMSSLNPVFTVGVQIREAIFKNDPKMPKSRVYKKVIELLDKVGITNPEAVYRLYPHQISGGMRQRIVIAMAIACNPKLIIADEPTTALDVTIQLQILSLLKNINQDLNSGILLITHDWGVVSEIADYVLVMYGGRIVESADIYEIYFNPKHPYTIQLLNIRKDLINSNSRLRFIPGNVPDNLNESVGCYFSSRCMMRKKICDQKYPPTIDVGGNHKVACHFLL